MLNNRALGLQGIIHRDIKPENILLMADKSIKLADFGLSIDATSERPVTRAGTLDYMAPEVTFKSHAFQCSKLHVFRGSPSSMAVLNDVCMNVLTLLWHSRKVHLLTSS